MFVDFQTKVLKDQNKISFHDRLETLGYYFGEQLARNNLDVYALIDPSIPKKIDQYEFISFGKKFLNFLFSNQNFVEDFVDFLHFRIYDHYEQYLNHFVREY